MYLPLEATATFDSYGLRQLGRLCRLPTTTLPPARRQGHCGAVNFRVMNISRGFPRLGIFAVTVALAYLFYFHNPFCLETRFIAILLPAN
jgi:hypothetical protein